MLTLYSIKRFQVSSLTFSGPEGLQLEKVSTELTPPSCIPKKAARQQLILTNSLPVCNENRGLIAL
jgi:hypothetical protein